MNLRGQVLPATPRKFPVSGLCWLVLSLSLALAGCNSDWLNARDRRIEANTRPPSESYRADIVAFMRTYLNDPTGVRDAFVSEPALRTLENTDRYTVCLRYTARKGGGREYAPSKDSLVLFRHGRLDRMIDNAREACKDAAYQPFRELEVLSR
jgi:hypothetical protein